MGFWDAIGDIGAGGATGMNSALNFSPRTGNASTLSFLGGLASGAGTAGRLRMFRDQMDLHRGVMAQVAAGRQSHEAALNMKLSEAAPMLARALADKGAGWAGDLRMRDAHLLAPMARELLDNGNDAYLDQPLSAIPGLKEGILRETGVSVPDVLPDGTRVTLRHMGSSLGMAVGRAKPPLTIKTSWMDRALGGSGGPAAPAGGGGRRRTAADRIAGGP